MSGFNNPVVGGSGDLIRNAIESPNFVPGEEGWQINRDGTATFAGVNVYGQIIVENTNDGVFVYAYFAA